MKFSLRLALTIFLSGTSVLLLISFLSYHYHARSLMSSELATNKQTAASLAQNIGQLLIEKTKTALALAHAPTIKAALMESNAAYTAMGEAERRSLIKRRDDKWRTKADARDPFILEYTGNAVSQYLETQQDALKDEYGEIFLTNRFGALEASTAKLTTFAHAHKYWWQEAYSKGAGGFFFDDRGYDESVNDYVLGVVVPVFKDSRLIGILKCNINILGAVSQLMADEGRSLPGQLKLVRSGGMVVFEHGARPLSTKLPVGIKEKLNRASAGSFVFQGKTEERLVGFSEIRFSDYGNVYRFGGSPESIDHKKGNQGESWYVLHLQDMQSLRSPVKESTRNTMLTVFGIILVLMVVAFFVARRMAAPLVDLSRKLEQIEKGEFGVKIQSKRKDEVGLLAGAFDHMSERLAHTTTSIELLESEVDRRKASEAEKEQLIVKLKATLAEVKTLSGLLPICSHCKKIRDDQGYWNRLEAYIQEHTDAKLSHSICRECAARYYPDMGLYDE